MEKATVEIATDSVIGAKEAALTFAKDGTMTLLVPRIDPVPDYVMNTVALAMLISDGTLNEIIKAKRDLLDMEIFKIEAKNKEEHDEMPEQVAIL